jgi:ribosomal protein L21E
MVGEIKSKNGTCYNVTVMDHDKEKTLIVHPVHLKKM